MMTKFWLIPLAFIFSCATDSTIKFNQSVVSKESFVETDKQEPDTIETAIIFEEDFIAHKFDFPVGKPDADGYYDAQKFGENYHLGEDWNGNGGGNTDLGDPVYSIADGYVKFAEDIGGGWGNVVRILHQLPDGMQIESLYAHCDTILVKAGDWIKRGDEIGTIGTAHGLYWAHLHFELRKNLNLPVGGGYSTDQSGYINPTKFILDHR